MLRPIRTAVSASADASVLHTVARLLAESEVELLACAQNGAQAVELLKTFRPDLLVADMPLPAIDGCVLTESALGTFSLPVRPMAILLHSRAFSPPNRARLEALGAKLLEKPLDSAAFANAIAFLAQNPPRFPETERRAADVLLKDLGIPDHIGRKLLQTAVLLRAHGGYPAGKQSASLIPTAAQCLGVSPKQAERAMRHAIAQAWRSDKFENQYRIFSDTVDAKRGQPTLSQMISRLADILRLEG